MAQAKRFRKWLAASDWMPLAFGPFAFVLDVEPEAPADLRDVLRQCAFEMYVDGLRALDAPTATRRAG